MKVGLDAFILLATALFSVGLFGALSKRSAIMVLMALELMANAVNILLVAASRYVTPATMDGWFFAVFSLVVSAAEIGLGLSLVLALYRKVRTAELDRLETLKG
ncbi:MAG TPA: NADH-quinone oxidoreductase subunit NuoK [Coriobacteriia bacterium]